MLADFVESVRSHNSKVAAAASPAGETPPEGVSPLPAQVGTEEDEQAAALAAVAKLEQEEEERELAAALAQIERTESGGGDISATAESLNSSIASRESFQSAASQDSFESVDEDENAEVAKAIEQIQQMESANATSRGADERQMDTRQLMEALELATDEEKRRLYEAGERGEELPVGLRISTAAEGPGVIQGYRLAGRFSKTDEYTVQVCSLRI
jgi:hypothetical protein